MDEVEKEGQSRRVAKLFGERCLTPTELFVGEISQIWVSLLIPETLKQNN